MRYLNGVKCNEEAFRRIVCNRYTCDLVATHYVVEYGRRVLTAYCREDGQQWLDDLPEIYTRLLNKRYFDSRCESVARPRPLR